MSGFSLAPIKRQDAIIDSESCQELSDTEQLVEAIEKMIVLSSDRESELKEQIESLDGEIQYLTRRLQEANDARL